MVKKDRPQPLTGGKGAGTHRAGARVRPNFPFYVDEDQTEFWLHVDANGREHRWPHEPDHKPTVYVELVRARNGVWFEQARTVNYKFMWGAFGEIHSIRPRGDGWRLHDATSDNCTYWRRRIKMVQS